MSNTKYYDFHLPYFKQGDDLGGCIPESADRENLTAKESAEAFALHADLMDSARVTLKKMAGYAIEHNIRLAHADVHFISVECDPEIGEHLVKEGLLSPSPFEDEDEGQEE